jgi:hypothetical protein
MVPAPQHPKISLPQRFSVPAHFRGASCLWVRGSGDIFEAWRPRKYPFLKLGEVSRVSLTILLILRVVHSL